MKKLLILSIFTLVLLTIGCEPPKGEPVEYSKMCDASSDGKTVETKGVLDSGTGVYCSNRSGRMECGFKLKNDLKDEKGNSVDIAIGSGANSMDKLESGYQKEDINIRGNNGNKIDLSKQVTITGKVRSTKDSVSGNVICYTKVYKIEQ